MKKREILLNESEFINLIKTMVNEAKEHEMEEGWLGDKFSDLKRGVRHFATGHESSEDRERKVINFFNELERIEDEVMENPSEWLGGKNWESMKQRLITQAEANDFKGQLDVIGGKGSGYRSVKYKEGHAGYRQAGIGARSGMGSSHTFGSGDY
jgi:hypothetical protein